VRSILRVPQSEILTHVIERDSTLVTAPEVGDGMCSTITSILPTDVTTLACGHTLMTVGHWRDSVGDPSPSRQPRTIAPTRPGTLRTIFAFPSLKLTMNSSAALRTSSFSAYDTSSMEPYPSAGAAGDGGKANMLGWTTVRRR
jgi:hypothetical protein